MKSIVDRGRAALDTAGVAVGDRLLVAVSGGVDSMVLLDVLDRVRGDMGIQLHIAHLDHALRRESPADREFVAAEARRRGLPCASERRDVAAAASGRWSEEAARLVRYAFLEEVAQTVNASHIALGHQADDQAETVLMRLLRGSGATGLRAMDSVRGGRYVRPLLEVWRAEIETYAREHRISYKEDASISDRRFLRNRVRGDLLPLLRQYNANISEVLHRTARLLKDEDALMAELAQEALTAVVCERFSDKIALDSKVLVDYHIAVQRRVVRAVLGGLSIAEGRFDFAVVERILHYIAKGDRHLRELGNGIRGQGGGNCYILRRGHRPEVACSLSMPGVLAVPGHGAEVHCELAPVTQFDHIRGELGGPVAAFDADRMGKRLCLRSPRPGDRIRPLGMLGHKKLSDLFTDRKWPRISRDEVLVLACGEEIAWVAPLCSSHEFRVDADTVRMALFRLRPAHREA